MYLVDSSFLLDCVSLSKTSRANSGALTPALDVDESNVLAPEQPLFGCALSRWREDLRLPGGRDSASITTAGGIVLG